MKRRTEGRFKNLSSDTYKSWDIPVGLRRRKEERDEWKRTNDGFWLCRNFTRPVLLFPANSLTFSRWVWDIARLFLWSDRGEMITTPNRLREEIPRVHGVSVCYSHKYVLCTILVDKEAVDEWKRFSNWSRNGLLGLLLARFVPLSGLLKSRHEAEQLALRQSVCCCLLPSWNRLVCLSCSLFSNLLLSFLLVPSPSHSVCFPFGSTTPPRHTLSLSLLLCFCNLFVSASSGFLFPPPPSCSFVPTVPVRESRRPPTEPPSHTHRTAGASLSPEVLALESLVRAPATPGLTDLLSTSSWDNPR